jgi:hypothetical protein
MSIIQIPASAIVRGRPSASVAEQGGKTRPVVDALAAR